MVTVTVYIRCLYVLNRCFPDILLSLVFWLFLHCTVFWFTATMKCVWHYCTTSFDLTFTVQGNLKPLLPMPGSLWSSFGQWDVLCTSFLFTMSSTTDSSKSALQQERDGICTAQYSPTYPLSSSNPLYWSGKPCFSGDGFMTDGSTVTTCELTGVTKRKCLSHASADLDWEIVQHLQLQFYSVKFLQSAIITTGRCMYVFVPMYACALLRKKRLQSVCERY